jgi:WD40 repeat protein/tRNA A-37 threonylcarbamoyl transferase component Bud32
MHDPDSPDLKLAPTNILERIDWICDRFEADWKSGDRPRIEDHLEAIEPEYRLALLRDLLEAEIAARRRRGERPDPSEYAVRFADAAEVITAAFSGAAAAGAGAQPAATVDDIAGPLSSGAFRAEQERTRTHVAERRQLGKFELLEQVGLGAFGAVWRARDTELDRLVAVKIPHAGHLASEAEAQRFYREARSAARLRHPGIVTVYDVGRYENLPYLVADFIEGVTLADLLSARRLDFPEAAALLAEVAEATDYAHSMGVVHRDIKPSNIIVDRTSIHRGAGQGTAATPGRPMLMDFGIARQDGAEATMTQEGDVLGTPAYMSPEQAAGHSHSVDGRSDVYSLGVVLYVLLTGAPPFRGTIRMLIDQVLREEPRPPRRLNDQVPRDLETVCLKAMAKDPGSRYATARELAEDLRRFLVGRPVRARPVPFWERGWRWSRRHPAQALLAVASGVAALALVGAAVGASFNAELTRLNRQLEATNRTLQQTNSALAASHMEEETQRRRAEQNLFYRNMLLAGRELQENHIGRALDLLDQTPAEFRGWEWNYLRRQCHVPLENFAAPGPEVYGVAVSGDGRLVAACTRWSGRVRVCDLSTGRPKLPDLVAPEQCVSVAIRPDGTQLAAGGLPGADIHDQIVRVWDLGTGRVLHELRGHSNSVQDVTYSRDGRTIASASLDGTVRLWDAGTGRPLQVLSGPCGAYVGVALSPDGQRVYGSAGSFDISRVPPPPYEITLWDAQTRVRLKGFAHDSPLVGVAVSHDESRLAAACMRGTILLWDLKHDQDGRNPRLLRGHTINANRVSFNADGTRLASCSDDGSIRIWDVILGEELFTLRGHRATVQSVTFHPDGNRVVSASSDGTVGLWDARTDPESRAWTGHSEVVEGLAYSPDGSRLASVSSDRQLRFWDPASGRAIGEPVAIGEKGNALAFHPDGHQIAIACGDWSVLDTLGVIDIRDVADGRLLRRMKGHRRIAWGVAYHPHGDWLASAGGEAHIPGEIILWNPNTGDRIASLPEVPEGLRTLACHPDGSALVTGSLSGTIRLWDVGRREMSWARRHHQGFVESVSFSPSGASILSAGDDGRLKLLNTRDGTESLVLPAFTHAIDCAIASPDGRRIATASADGRVQVWDASTGEELLSLRYSRRGIAPHRLAFRPDGMTLAAGGYDGGIRVWDARPLPNPVSR